MTEEQADAKAIAEAAVQRHRDEVAEETANSGDQSQESLTREMWGQLKVIGRVQSDQLVEAVKTNHRINKLEAWQNRIIGAAILAAVGAPLLTPGVRQWLTTILGG